MKFLALKDLFKDALSVFQFVVDLKIHFEFFDNPTCWFEGDLHPSPLPFNKQAQRFVQMNFISGYLLNFSGQRFLRKSSV